jgi:uncharacterized protein YbjT (DUF2867 family)
VLGATGAQGSSVVRGLLRRRFHVRALTRTPESDAAERLRRAGAEVVRGDFADRASLRAALHSCRAVFASTCCLAPVDREIANGRNMINAVAGAEVDSFVFSTRQQELEAYARSLELPVIFLRVSCGDEAAIDALGDTVVSLLETQATVGGDVVSVGVPNASTAV